MCGRYVSAAEMDDLIDEFAIDQADEELPAPSWNVAPTDPVPAVLERLSSDQADRPGEAVRKLRPLHWGLVPSWAKDRSIGSRMINARVETVAEKPAFRKAFTARRCLLPADGYFEWYDTGQLSPPSRAGNRKPVKQPYFLHRADGGTLAMAGLYEYWRSATGEWHLSCTVITTRAEDAAGRIHDRMPMIIDRDAWDDWLDPLRTDADDALELLQVVTPTALEIYPVSPAVGSVRNNGPELLDRVPATGEG